MMVFLGLFFSQCIDCYTCIVLTKKKKKGIVTALFPVDIENPSNLFGCFLSKHDRILTLFFVFQQHDAMQKMKNCSWRNDPISQTCLDVTGGC